MTVFVRLRVAYTPIRGKPSQLDGIKHTVPTCAITYDHIHLKTRDPVRSPIDKQVRARLVLGSVTTGESLVLYVFFSL